MAIGFVDDGDHTSFPISFTETSGTYINASMFFRANNLDPRAYAGRHQYTVRSGADIDIDHDGIDAVFLIDLSHCRASGQTDL